MDAAEPLPELVLTYLQLAFRLHKHIDGLVDAYYGPPELRAAVEAEPLIPLPELEVQAADLAAGLAAQPGKLRVRFLRQQVAALRAQIADQLSQQTALSYLDYVRAIYDVAPQPVPDAQIHAYQAEVRRLLSGLGFRQSSPAQAIAAFEATDQLSGEQLSHFFSEQAARLKLATRQAIPYLPADEGAVIEGVTDKPWGAYNWYLGGYRSRIEINLDLPLNRHNATSLVRHEIYPGHHTDHAAHEQHLYRGQGRLEAAIKLINTPDCPIAEGLADVGYLLLEGGHYRMSETEQLYRTISDLRRAVGINAAIMYYTGVVSQEEAVAYRMAESWVDERRAQQSMRFVTHPLWRAYVFTYWNGGAIIEQAIGAAKRVGKLPDLIRLLYTELLTPTLLREELAASGVHLWQRPCCASARVWTPAWCARIRKIISVSTFRRSQRCRRRRARCSSSATAWAGRRLATLPAALRLRR